MRERKRVSRRSLKSDLARVDAHSMQPEEYKELPELTDEMLAGSRQQGGAIVLSQSEEADLLALAGGRHRALAGHWARLANTDGTSPQQGSLSCEPAAC